MPEPGYYRKQAQLFARLAVTTSDPQVAERCTRMALEQLAKAGEADPERPSRALHQRPET
jgi:hypothetical protein